MAMTNPRPREVPPSTAYTYRRRLEPAELLPAIGVGAAVGAAAGYVMYLFLQRTPLDISGTRRDHLSRRPPAG